MEKELVDLEFLDVHERGGLQDLASTWGLAWSTSPIYIYENDAPVCTIGYT